MADIKRNLVFLSENITNLQKILLYLIQEDIISESERESIKNKENSLERNEALLTLMGRKNWEKNRNLFLEILRNTLNGHCADVIEEANKSETKESMQKTVATVRELLEKLNLNKSNNELLVEQKKTNEGSSKEMNEKIWFGITTSNRFFTGREKEMQLLEGYWNNCLENDTFLLAVTGLGGVGKTELAKNYAKWFHEHVGGHCIWIEAETNQSMEQSFTNLAANMNISLNDDLGNEKKFLEIVQDVYEKLLGQTVLLTFDNLENYELPVLKLLIDLASKKPPRVLKPFVITTSRHCEAKKYFGAQCNALDLQVLTKDSAMKFFYKSLSLDEPPENTIKELIEKLCERLQSYPLALQQAASYINEMSLYCPNEHEAITQYLMKIERESKMLLNRKLPYYDALENISNTTFLTWTITFSKLSKESGELVIEIMNIISYLSSDHIPTHFVERLLQKMGKMSTVTNVEDFFRLIRKYSLINYTGVNLVSVHRLVQEVTRIQLQERGEFRSLLSQITKSMTNMLKADEISSEELVHAQMVCLHLAKDKELIQENAEFPSWICHKLHSSGKYRHLLDFSRESEVLLEFVIGENSRGTLKMKWWVGRALRELGDYSESLRVLTDVGEKQKKAFGEEDPGWLDTAHELGGVYWLLGKYEEAMETFQNILEKHERVFGKEGARTLSLKGNIALVLDAQNKFVEAMKLFEEVLKGKERLLGVEHPETLTTKHNIAVVKFRQKNYGEALKEFQEVLEIRERVLEVDHPDTLTTKYSIALTYYHLDRHQESLQLFKEVHKNRAQILGPRHPETVRAEKWIEDVTKEIAPPTEK